MFTKATANSVFSLTFQADPRSATEGDFYTLSRSMLRVKRETSPQVTKVAVVCADNTPVYFNNTYYTDPDGVLEIPLKNIINTYYNLLGTFGMRIDFFNLDGTTAETAFSLVCYSVRGISYHDSLAPRNKEADTFVASFFHYVTLPPNVMYNPSIIGTGNGQGIIAESNIQDYNKNCIWSHGASGVFSTITPSGDRTNQLVIPYSAEVLRLDDGTSQKNWKLEKGDFCADWAVVRWTSLTGAVRQHYFPVVAFINDVDDEISIVEAGNGYDVRKNVYKGVRCRIEGLTKYGVWYYQDLIQASDVHAIIHPTFSIFSTEIASMETAAFIEGGVPETPQGNGFYTFDFTIKLRHYDTF